MEVVFFTPPRLQQPVPIYREGVGFFSICNARISLEKLKIKNNGKFRMGKGNS